MVCNNFFYVFQAIDFGTTYSGYAFSFIHDPEEIHMMRKWEGNVYISHVFNLNCYV